MTTTVTVPDTTKFWTVPNPSTDLWNASLIGNVEQVNRLIRSGVDVHEKVLVLTSKDPENPYTTTPISVAVHQRHPLVVLALLQAGADANSVGLMGLRLLHMASKTGSVEIVTHLIHFKADVSSTDDINNTALYYAKLFQQTEVVKIIEEAELSREKCVAFAMGHHKRLGVSSLMFNIDPEVLRIVVAQV
jgi:ankyrin repeat protein